MKEEKKLVGQLRVRPDRFRKIRNSFFKSFYKFQTNLNFDDSYSHNNTWEHFITQ
jgi:hypothetical protein